VDCELIIAHAESNKWDLKEVVEIGCYCDIIISEFSEFG
jgi:hypothetical protein